MSSWDATLTGSVVRRSSQHSGGLLGTARGLSVSSATRTRQVLVSCCLVRLQVNGDTDDDDLCLLHAFYALPSLRKLKTRCKVCCARSAQVTTECRRY